MAAQSLRYQRIVKRLFSLPFFFMVVLGSCVFSLNDLSRSMQHQTKQARIVSQLLAKTATTKNTTLISQQVEMVLSEYPEIRSIMFLPISQPQAGSNTIENLRTYAFAKYFGVSEPVMVTLPKRASSPNTVQQLIGYINTTVDIEKVRKRWLLRNALLWLIMLSLALAIRWWVLRRLTQLTQGLPEIEQLSKQILDDQDIDTIRLDHFTQNDNPKADWLFAKAILNLIGQIKVQRHQIHTLTEVNSENRDKELLQLQQYSNFQSTLTQEFKLSLDRIQSGLQLLKNQYISNEQKDAVDIIDYGMDSLNAKLNQIIQMNRIEKGQTTLSISRFSPTQLLSDLTDSFQAYAREKNILLLSKIHHTDYLLDGDVAKITAIISALLDNALKFTDKGSVTVVSHLQHLSTNVRWTLEVQDTGIGIEPRHLQQIFQPFFQVNPNKAHDINSRNIGLFLAKKLSDLMSGELTVVSELDKGSTFSFSLVLEDGKYSRERSILTGKRIVVWYQQSSALTHLPRLKDAGAIVTTFFEEQLLTEHILAEPVDMLLISASIPLDQVKRFVRRLREHETTHRTLVVVYYKSLVVSVHDRELLKILGVDYLENIDQAEGKLDDYIERMVQYLS